jgi:hypothetical protein
LHGVNTENAGSTLMSFFSVAWFSSPKADFGFEDTFRIPKTFSIQMSKSQGDASNVREMAHDAATGVKTSKFRLSFE